MKLALMHITMRANRMVVAVDKVDKASEPSEMWSEEYVFSPKVTTRTIDKALTELELILRAYTQGLRTTSGRRKKVEIDCNHHQLALALFSVNLRNIRTSAPRTGRRRAPKLPLPVQVVCHFRVA
jgi:hypothetical protein